MTLSKRHKGTDSRSYTSRLKVFHDITFYYFYVLLRYVHRYIIIRGEQIEYMMTTDTLLYNLRHGHMDTIFLDCKLQLCVANYSVQITYFFT